MRATPVQLPTLAGMELQPFLLSVSDMVWPFHIHLFQFFQLDIHIFVVYPISVLSVILITLDFPSVLMLMLLHSGCSHARTSSDL